MKKSYPKLYENKETNFSHNGLGVLKDCVSAEVIEERNGMFELELTYKVGSFLCDQLKEENIIKVNANPKLSNQKFRIYKTTKNINGTIKVYAKHISYDLGQDVIESVSVDGNCQMALQAIFDNSQYCKHYNAKSSISMTAKFNLSFVNCLEAIAGVEGSIIDTYGNGADILRDNETISVEKNRGQDTNILIAYKKNITGLDAEEDWSNMCTRLLPYAKISGDTVDSEEQIITLDEKFVDSSIIDNYSKKYIKVMEFTNVKTKEELKDKAINYMTSSKNDTPKITYTINFIPLINTEEYKNYALLENIDLCDSVIVRDMRFGINTKMKCIGYRYDSILGRYNELTLGNPKTSLTAAMTGSDDSKDDVKEPSLEWDKILQNAIKDMTDKITGNQGGHVVLYPPQEPSEIFIMDTPSVNTAMKVLRINNNGIGFSKSGVNGPFLTGWDIDGNFLADCITTGTLNANLIKAGVLQSFNSKTWINMSDGTFSFADGKIIYDGSDININADNIQINSEDVTTIGTVRSEIKQTATEINLSVKNSGLSNLARNTKFAKGLNYWTIAGSPTATVVYGDESNYLKLTTTGNNQYIKQTMKFEANKKYTLQAYVTVETGVEVGIQCYCNGTWYSSKTTTNGIITLQVTSTSSQDAEIQLGRGSWGTNGISRWMWCYCVAGDYAKGWLPHEEEIYSSNVKLDSKSFEVSFSNGTKMLCDVDTPLTLVDGNSNYQYHALSSTGSSVAGGDLPATVTIQLPDIFKGKNFTVTLSTKSTRYTPHVYGDVVGAMYLNLIARDIQNATFSVQADWTSYSIPAQKELQRELEFTYTVIA